MTVSVTNVNLLLKPKDRENDCNQILTQFRVRLPLQISQKANKQDFALLLTRNGVIVNERGFI